MPPLGEPLVQQVAAEHHLPVAVAHHLPVAVARLVIVAVLREVAADLRSAFDPVGELTDLAIVGRALALRMDYAIERCEPHKWPVKNAK